MEATKDTLESLACELCAGARRQLDLVTSSLVFPEGPRWRDGTLYVSDMHGGRVIAIAPSGAARTLFELDGKPSGLGFDPGGGLLVAEMLSRRILRWNGSRLEQHADLSAVAPFPINDMLVDPIGRCYVGTLGIDPWRGTSAPDDLPDTARQQEEIGAALLFLVQPDGTVATAASDLLFPNGMALSRDGRRLFVAETYGHRISQFAVDAQGRLSSRQDFVIFHPQPSRTVPEALASGRVMPDGVALDRHGALWVADANGSGALKLAPDGTIVDRIFLDDLAIFAVALSGDDDALYACAAPRLPDRARRPAISGAVYRCDLRDGRD